MKKIAIIPNKSKDDAILVANEILSEFKDFCFMADDDEKLAVEADVAIVLGGDGTMLRALKRCRKAALLGINFGHMGYMTSAEKGDAISAVKQLISGNYTVEKRMMLDIFVERDGKYIAQAEALNDGVIARTERILSLSEYFDEELVYNLTGDGIIVATPTGSTAYSLAAGGPVALPDMEVIITTPVCPHAMHIRPVIASSDTSVSVVIEGKRDNRAVLCVDGQNVCSLFSNDKVVFKKSDTEAKLICLEKKNFYDILRYKLSN